MSEQNWTRIAAVSGIAFVICILISAFIGGTPVAAGDSTQDIAQYFVDNSDRLLAGTYFQGLGDIFFILFLGVLYRRLADAGATALAVSLAIAAAFTGAVVMGAQVSVATLAFRTAEAGESGVTIAYFDAALIAYNMTAFGMAAIAATAGLAMIFHGTAARWLGYVGLVSAVINLIAAGSFAKDGLFEAGGVLGLVGMLGFLVFILAASIVTLIEAAGQPSPARRTATA